MRFMVTVSPNDSSVEIDFFNATLEDDKGTLMVFCWEELAELVEHEELCRLLCGDEISFLLPEHGSGMTTSDYAALERYVGAAVAEPLWSFNSIYELDDRED